MYFKEESYDLVEQTILNNQKFNHNQREFIELMDTGYIIAGPGVGKTTCLAAKIVLLLMRIATQNSKEAICIITHTNVAVDEINKILRQLGLSQINHPHFVGTVHHFFNTFLSIPYIKKQYGPKNIRFGDDIDYLTLTTRLVHKCSYFGKWSSKRAREFVAGIINQSELAYDEKDDKFILINTAGWEKFEKHYGPMLDIKLQLKRLGFFSYNDTFLFAKAALAKHKTRDLLKRRFKYIFVDEFQDTDISSLEILKKIFTDEGNIMQLIGDPNQTLDFNGQMPRVDDYPNFELKICNRFGNQIGNHLLHIVSGAKMEYVDGKKSFNPLLIIYNSKDQLIPSYKKFFSEYFMDEGSVRNSRKDSILSIRKNAIYEFQTGSYHGSFSSNQVKINEPFTLHLIKLINEMMFKRISNRGEFQYDIKTWIKEHSVQTYLKKSLVRSIKSGQLSKTEIVSAINTILKEQGTSLINSSNSLFSHIETVLKLASGSVDLEPEKDREEEFVFGTIHSAKGETHRSVLLIDSDAASMIHTRMLKSFYCYDQENYDSEWVARNLLYVAMSRPTHLFAFGMDARYINANEVKIFRNKGWDIKYASNETESVPEFELSI